MEPTQDAVEVAIGFSELVSGLITATVEANCTDPPAELTFQNVPARSTREGTIVCPPGTRDPAVSVTTWIRE